MTTWFTADLHFGHANIINYSDRPFANATAMNQALIDLDDDNVLRPSRRFGHTRRLGHTRLLAAKVVIGKDH